MPLAVQMGGLQVLGWLQIIPKRAVNVLLETTYIEKCARGILPIEWKIVPAHLAPRAILGRGTEAHVTTILSLHEAPIDERNKHAMIGVAELITIPAGTESSVDFVMYECGIIKRERTQTAELTKQILSTRDVHEVHTTVSFQILVTHFLKKHAALEKYMCFVSGTGPQERFMELERNEGLKPEVEVDSVHYKDVEDRKTQIERHMKLELEYAWRMTHDWKEAVKIDPKFDTNQEEFIEMMTVCEYM